MSIKSCCYKDCGNFNINNIPNGSFTLFQFPKDPVRRKQWMELGQVDPATAPNALLMCSDHFDRSKYMSVNPRRTMLVGAAVPYPYCSKNDCDETSNDTIESVQDTVDASDGDPHNASFVYYEEDNEDADVPDIAEPDEDQEEDQYPVEFSIEDDDTDNMITYKEVSIDIAGNCSESEEIGNVVVNKNVNPEVSKQVFRISSDDGYKVYEKPQTPSRKRKILEVSNISTEGREVKEQSKPRSIFNTHTSPKFILQDISVHNDANGNSVEFDQETLMDPQHIATFIYKGEECVRMSKKYYLREKSKLLHKILKYEKVLKTIKQNVDILDLS